MEGALYDECKTLKDKDEFIKRCLFARRKEQMMKNLSWRDHKEFLPYFNKTKTAEDYEKLKYRGD